MPGEQGGGAAAPGSDPVPPRAAQGAAPDLTTYRRRRRNAVRVTVVVVALVASFGFDAVRVLHEGGDTRFGIFPYLLCVASAVFGGTVAVSLWRRAAAARRHAMPRVPVAEPEPRPHLGLNGSVPPPSRW